MTTAKVFLHWSTAHTFYLGGVPNVQLRGRGATCPSS
jgi:hypothetical protein